MRHVPYVRVHLNIALPRNTHIKTHIKEPLGTRWRRLPRTHARLHTHSLSRGSCYCIVGNDSVCVCVCDANVELGLQHDDKCVPRGNIRHNLYGPGQQSPDSLIVLVILSAELSCSVGDVNIGHNFPNLDQGAR